MCCAVFAPAGCGSQHQQEQNSAAGSRALRHALMITCTALNSALQVVGVGVYNSAQSASMAGRRALRT
jgi:hypothetical protein